MTEKTEIPDGFKDLYDSWHKQYIEEDKEWVRRVKNNPFIAIDKHINEDTITDLLAHILQTDKSIKTRFLNFLLNEGGNEEVISEEVAINKTEIKTQEWIRDDNKISRLDLLIIIDNKYYIVIENKIFDAPEQPKQMERYIKGITEKLGAIKENVLAFYATPDGQGKCKTAGKYKDIVKPLAFYSDKHQEQTIYSVLMDVKNSIPPLSITQDFCFYLKYKFYNQQAVSFFNDFDKNKGRCWEKILDDLYKNKYYPSISKKINPYDKSEEYFTQLIKVHALNSYLLKKFKNKNYHYHNVFDGFSIRKKATISETDCNVYFETKYDKNYFFMVITICSLKKIDNKIEDLLKEASEYLYREQNKFNKERSYSLWLWIQDPSELKKNWEKIEDLSGDDYISYIDFIFEKCMKKIFDGIQEKEIDPEALKIYKNLRELL